MGKKEEFDVSEYTEANQPLAQRVMQKRWDNHKRVARLEQMGSQLDVSVARMEFFQKQLVKLGILTEATALEMQMEWEENMAAQLAMIEDRAAVAREKAEQAMREQIRKAQLAGPGARSGIMLPNGRVHLPKPEGEPGGE